MTVCLRPHHLLCLLTYAGKGYTPVFTANFNAIAGRLADGEGIAIVHGPDDICAPLLGEGEAHCRKTSVTDRDRLAARDLGGLIGMPIESGTTINLDPALLKRMRDGFSAGHVREACTGCEWAGLCSTIAADNFGTARVRLAESVGGS